MKKSKFCGFCKQDIKYKAHLTVLAILHLEIEHHPRADFTTSEIFEKSSGLRRHINEKNIHLNISYATTQLINLEIRKAASRTT